MTSNTAPQHEAPDRNDPRSETVVPRRKLLTQDQEAEIKALREASFQTRRATVPDLEEILYQPLPVLDHGFVRVVDYMGDDGAIVQAARVSYGRGTKQVRADAGLINYLLRHRHTTPFEMCEIKYLANRRRLFQGQIQRARGQALGVHFGVQARGLGRPADRDRAKNRKLQFRHREIAG